MAEIENLEDLNPPAASPAVPGSSRAKRMKAEIGRRLSSLWNSTSDLVEMPLALTTFALMWIQLVIALLVAFFYSTAYPAADIALFMLVPVVLLWMRYEIPGFTWTEVCNASGFVLVPLYFKFNSALCKEEHAKILVKTFWSIGLSLVNIASMWESEDYNVVGIMLTATWLIEGMNELLDALLWYNTVFEKVYLENPDPRTLPPKIVLHPLFSVFSDWVASSNYTLSYGDIDHTYKTSGNFVNANHLFCVNIVIAMCSALLALVIGTRKRNLIAQRRKERAGIEERQRQMAERAEKEDSSSVASSFVLIDRSDGGSVCGRSQSSASQRFLQYKSRLVSEEGGDGTALDKAIRNHGEDESVTGSISEGVSSCPIKAESTQSDGYVAVSCARLTDQPPIYSPVLNCKVAVAVKEDVVCDTGRNVGMLNRGRMCKKESGDGGLVNDDAASEVSSSVVVINSEVSAGSIGSRSDALRRFLRGKDRAASVDDQSLSSYFVVPPVRRSNTATSQCGKDQLGEDGDAGKKAALNELATDLDGGSVFSGVSFARLTDDNVQSTAGDDSLSTVKSSTYEDTGIVQVFSTVHWPNFRSAEEVDLRRVFGLPANATADDVAFNYMMEVGRYKSGAVDDEAAMRYSMMYCAMIAPNFKLRLKTDPVNFPSADVGFLLENYTKPGSDERVGLFYLTMQAAPRTVAVIRIRSDVGAALSSVKLGCGFEFDVLGSNLTRDDVFLFLVVEEASRLARLIPDVDTVWDYLNFICQKMNLIELQRFIRILLLHKCLFHAYCHVAVSEAVRISIPNIYDRSDFIASWICPLLDGGRVTDAMFLAERFNLCGLVRAIDGQILDEEKPNHDVLERDPGTDSYYVSLRRIVKRAITFDNYVLNQEREGTFPRAKFWCPLELLAVPDGSVVKSKFCSGEKTFMEISKHMEKFHPESANVQKDFRLVPCRDCVMKLTVTSSAAMNVKFEAEHRRQCLKRKPVHWVSFKPHTGLHVRRRTLTCGAGWEGLGKIRQAVDIIFQKVGSQPLQLDLPVVFKATDGMSDEMLLCVKRA